MKKIISLLIVFSLLFFNLGFISPASAQTHEIASVDVAEQIAADAGGSYVSGSAVPAVTGSEVALPVIDEATGNVLGHIVADQASLISALEAMGMTDIAAAIAAGTAGATAGAATGAGFALGTTGTVALVVAAGIGIGLAVGSDGGSTTSHH